MDEPVLDLDSVDWTPQKELVRIFYKEMWDKADVSLVPRIFHPDFTFRGSLGPTHVGFEQFIGYVDFVTGADVPRLYAPNWIRRDLSSLHGRRPVGNDGQAD